jgi:hypothetical protein
MLVYQLVDIPTIPRRSNQWASPLPLSWCA